MQWDLLHIKSSRFCRFTHNKSSRLNGTQLRGEALGPRLQHFSLPSTDVPEPCATAVTVMDRRLLVLALLHHLVQLPQANLLFAAAHILNCSLLMSISVLGVGFCSGHGHLRLQIYSCNPSYCVGESDRRQ